MNLKHGASSQRAVAIDGWDVGASEWEPCVALGSIRANDLYISGVDYTLKKRILACSHNDRIPGKHSLIRIADIPYIVEGENKNSWRGGEYQYVYQIRKADLMASLYRLVTTPKASGQPGQAVRTLIGTTLCDVAAAGQFGSAEIEATDYSRIKLYTPGNIGMDMDVEVEVALEVPTTFDVISVQRFNLCRVSTAIRRGVG